MTRVYRTRVEEVLAALTPAEADALRAHIDGGTSSRDIARILTSHGHPIAKSSINHHRKIRSTR